MSGVMGVTPARMRRMMQEAESASGTATTTHSQLDDAGLAAAGISAGTVRLSVGIEHIDDILADVERGLAAARAVGA